MARGKQQAVAQRPRSGPGAPEWERYQADRGGRHLPGLWLSISPCGSVTLSRDLARGMGVTMSRRGLALYRWPHDGELLVKLEAVDLKAADFSLTVNETGAAQFNSKKLGGWLGLGPDRAKRRFFEVSNLDGEFFFEAQMPPAASSRVGKEA